MPSSYKSPSPKSQAISCAECRRLKLKCDRVFPCSSCIRRGCANLCPEGTLEKGKRGFLRRLEQSLPSTSNGPGESSEVAMFVARDAAMSKRIQELEAALTNAGIPIPGAPMANSKALKVDKCIAPHPNKRARSSSPSGDNRTATFQASTNLNEQQSGDVAMGFGTLTIDVENRSRYIGVSGASAYLNTDFWKSRQNSQENLIHDTMPPDHGHPPSLNVNDLPPYEEALRLSDMYFVNASFMYEVVPKCTFFTDHLAPAYFSSHDKPTSHGVMALIYIVFALGSFFDASLPIVTAAPIAAHYHSLAVAWLSSHIPQDGVLRVDTIPAVQAVHLMALYHLSTRGEGDGEAAWQLLGIAMRSLKAQGCHRDGSRWNLPPKDSEERRRIFWETHMSDRIQSFTFGRPYALSDNHFDCEMPATCDTPLPSDSPDDLTNFSHTKWHQLKFQFASVLGHMGDRAFAVKHPTYSTIMQLDREINEFYSSLPLWAQCESVTNPVKELTLGPGKGKPEDMRRNAQIYSLSNMIFLSIMVLHRGPFCRALSMGTSEPLKSRYEASVISLTAAARAIINITRGMYALHPCIVARMWYFLFHSFTAAVCQSVLVIVAPFHPLAPLAYESMQMALELFTLVEGTMAETARVRIGKLAEKAKSVLDGWRDTHSGNPTATDAQSPIQTSSRIKSLEAGRFPESNMRGKPVADLLGTSTTLIRLQAEPPCISGSLPLPSSMAPSSFPSEWSDESFMNYLNSVHADPDMTYALEGEGSLDLEGFDLSSFMNAWPGSDNQALIMDDFFRPQAY